MLDPTRIWDLKVRPFLSPQVGARIANAPWQLEAYRRLRHEIFCKEQRLFETSDFDFFDRAALPIVALSHVAGMPDEVVGVVRIYETEPRVWFGGRLGVNRRYRSRGAVGSQLIECAVTSALELGCQRFFAKVQLANVRYFERHAFHRLEQSDVQGVPHQLMQADLESFRVRRVADATRAA